MTGSAGNNFKKVTHVIFDMDGLLLDTETVYEVIENKIANMYGKSLTHEVRLNMLGTTEQRSAEIAVNQLNLPTTVAEYLKHFHKLTEEMMQNTSLMQGAERLLRHLHAHNIPIALATSSGEPMVQVKTTNHRELFKLFHHRVCGSTDPEVKHGKPEPDIFQIAAARFDDKPDPAQCLVFEDAPNGVTAALAAGMQVVMVPDEHIVKGLKLEATQVLKSLEDFKPEEFGLPAFV